MDERDVRRATLALAQVKAVEKSPPKAQRAYATIAHRLPLLARRGGLSSALLFVGSRSKRSQRLLLTHLAEQLHDADNKLCKAPTPEALLQAARDADLWALERLGAEVERCLLWTKRLTVSVLGLTAADLHDDGEDDDGDEARP